MSTSPTDLQFLTMASLDAETGEPLVTIHWRDPKNGKEHTLTLSPETTARLRDSLTRCLAALETTAGGQRQ